jgi:hypothetical protein
MHTPALERELIRWRSGLGEPADDVLEISIEEALAYRDAGNVPDELGRTLRLVLEIHDEEDLARLDEKRAAFEPDYLDEPTWRRNGSRPVNVVPLRSSAVKGAPKAWWEDERMNELERLWATEGSIDGVAIPGDYRSFLFKTIVALRDSGREVSVDSICDALSRWLAPSQVDEIRTALVAEQR